MDPGEGTQRQLLHAGISSSQISKIFISHFHGDHCLGLPGVIQRLSLDRVAHPVEIFYPASGQKYLKHLLEAAIFHKAIQLVFYPINSAGCIYTGQDFSLKVLPLDHGVDTWGYRLKEKDSQTIQPKLLPAGLQGEDIGKLKSQGFLEFGHTTIMLQDVSQPKIGQVFSYVMDTRLCDKAFLLAQEADLLLCEATYLSSEKEQAYNYRHLTALQAAQIAQETNTKRLVLAHFSQRYSNLAPFAKEAAAVHPEVIVAHDLQEINVPERKRKL